MTGIRRREATLEHPTTISLSGASYTGGPPAPARHDARKPRAAGRSLTIRAPWITDLAPLLLRLRYFVEKDERLAADADTLALVSGRRPLREPR